MYTDFLTVFDFLKEILNRIRQRLEHDYLSPNTYTFMHYSLLISFEF